MDTDDLQVYGRCIVLQSAAVAAAALSEVH